MAGNETSIEILSDDCLLEIFRNLSFMDRIKIENVNARWEYLSKLSWRNVKKLDFHRPSWGIESSEFLLDIRRIKIYELEEVLERCGKYLEDIDASKIRNELRKLQMIASCCPSIKSLTAKITNVDSFATLIKNCKNIDELTLLLNEINPDDDEITAFSSCYKVNKVWENKLTSLFKANKNIRVLKSI